jgi:aminocarboxymuconate-semialdehyde decarboxylase
MHGHLLPRAWLEEAGRDPERYGVDVFETEHGHTVHRRGDPHGFNVFDGLSDPSMRFRLMDEMCVTSQLVAPPTPLLFHDLDRDAAVAISRLYNETISDLSRNAGGRLIPAATVPMVHQDVAVRELEHAVEQLGCRLLFLSTSIAGAELDDPRFEPILRRAAELGIPIQLHPCSPDVDARLQRRALPILLGNPIDTAIAAASLITGGVLDRIPDLKVMLVHGGGAFPYLSGRMEHGYDVIEKARCSERTPRSYLPRFHYDSLVHDEAALRFLVDTVGSEQVVVGTDAPYPMGDRAPLDSLARVGLADDEDVRSRNALRLLG